MTDNEDNIYKATIDRSEFRNELRSDIENNMKKFNDPIVLGELLYKLLEERENTNRILKNILAKLEKLENKDTSPAIPSNPIPILPSIDEKILNFVRASGKVTAEDVRKEFKYKGKNAASARLNKLFELNLVVKQQVGKKVFFFPV
jgi:predicted HTH transcriptional regulator